MLAADLLRMGLAKAAKMKVPSPQDEEIDRTVMVVGGGLTGLTAAQAAAGMANILTETGVPGIFGIVTAEDPAQAEARCGGKMGNRGWDAAQSAVEMANISEAFEVIEDEDLDEESMTPDELGELLQGADSDTETKS